MTPNFSGKGDGGKTTLYGGVPISKGSPVLELIGSIDELNAFIGLARSNTSDTRISTQLQELQQILSKLMGILAGVPLEDLNNFNIYKSVEWLEENISTFTEKTDMPKNFVFPGKTEIGAILDVCRTVSRRIERITNRDSASITESYPGMLAFLNRLSSYFFVLRLQSEK